MDGGGRKLYKIEPCAPAVKMIVSRECILTIHDDGTMCIHPFHPLSPSTIDAEDFPFTVSSPLSEARKLLPAFPPLDSERLCSLHDGHSVIAGGFWHWGFEIFSTDANDGRIPELHKFHSNRVTCLSTWRDTRHRQTFICAGSADSSISVWLEVDNLASNSSAFSVFGGRGKSQSSISPMISLFGHDSAVTHIDMNEMFVLSAGLKGSLIIHDVVAGKTVASLELRRRAQESFAVTAVALSASLRAFVGLTSGDIFCYTFSGNCISQISLGSGIGQILPLHAGRIAVRTSHEILLLAASPLHVEKLAAKCLDDEPSGHGHLPAAEEEKEGENSKFLQCEQNGGTLFLRGSSISITDMALGPAGALGLTTSLGRASFVLQVEK